MSHPIPPVLRSRALLARLAAAAAVLIASACSGGPVASVPTAQSVAGLAPSGTVRLNETFVAGAGGGSGTLYFGGRSHPFRLVGGVTGGMGLEKMNVAGEVYRLTRLSDFPGVYSQGSGSPGLDTSRQSDLWLQNGAGVIMHLTGSSSGMMLSLGRDEIVIEMTN